jgi:hypothetical protein
MAAQFSHPLAPAGASLPEARLRRPVTLRAQATRNDGSVFDATLTDLSYEGCGLQSRSPLRVGEAVRLTVEHGGTIRATVRWAFGSRAGLLFLADASPAPEPAQVERDHERISTTSEITLRRAGKLSFRVRLFDVSPAGCKAEFVERPEIGEQLWIKFDGMEAIEASVCWIAESRVGIRFARPIHPAVFEALVARLR